ncbi:hypothetical protein CYMTET_11671 [Cymbomonas tetramitiformis]|uniref:Uncharacterized protein n=1 Tax=Cymbomonas tetramitiformis TaxID=36881 RepID=A0AAE0GN83_9CHLO|nr:hypothetical protein CYMTET_11671 [Cymbomonas tetramitiformis]
MKWISLDETAKLEEEARKEEENVKNAAHAKELAEVSANLNELVDADGAAEQPPATGTDSGQTEAPVTDAPPEGDAAAEAQGKDTAWHSERPLRPVGDAPTE